MANTAFDSVGCVNESPGAEASATSSGAMAAELSGTDAAATTGSGDHDTRFFGQPWSLVHIFFVEMWERFSFYGMQGILLLYMYYSVTQGGLGMPEATAAGPAPHAGALYSPRALRAASIAVWPSR